LTAHVVERAEDWRWGSLWVRRHGNEQWKAILNEWPIPRPMGWATLVNHPMTEKEVEGTLAAILTNAAPRLPASPKIWLERSDLGLF
jgi:putative transposase